MNNSLLFFYWPGRKEAKKGSLTGVSFHLLLKNYQHGNFNINMFCILYRYNQKSICICKCERTGRAGNCGKNPVFMVYPIVCNNKYSELSLLGVILQEDQHRRDFQPLMNMHYSILNLMMGKLAS